MKGKGKPKMMAKKAMKKVAKNDAAPAKGNKGALMKRLEGREM